MKTMTCKQLGGACDEEFHAESWDEMVKKSQQHGKKMAELGDDVHFAAREDMKELMNDPEAMQEWREKKQKEFDELPEDEQ